MMEAQLKLTARGQAVCELMAEEALTLEAACTRIEQKLEALRQTVDGILAERSWEEVPGAMQAALSGVSLILQEAYLEEESARASGEFTARGGQWLDGAGVH